MHLLLAVVATSALIRGESPKLGPLVLKRFLPFGAGVLVVPAMVAATYAHWGTLDKLFYDMFVLPRQLDDYYHGVQAPPRVLALTVIAAAAACTAGMLVAARRYRSATAAGVGAASALVLAWLKFGPGGFSTWDATLWARSLDAYGGVGPFAIGSAAIAAAAPQILSRRSTPRGVEIETVILVAIVLVLQFSCAPDLSS